MHLKGAIARATKFALAAKAGGPLSGILLVPAFYDESKQIEFFNGPDGLMTPIPTRLGYVQASDGVVTLRVYLDPDIHIPHVVAEADGLQRSTSSFKKEPFTIERSGNTTVTVRGLNGAHFQVPAQHASAFPGDPEFPERLWPFWRARDVCRLLHVTKKVEKDRPELLFLHAYAGCVESSDQTRTARVPVGMPVAEGRLMHRDLWAYWPRTEGTPTAFAVHKDIAFVSVEDELRWGPAPTDEKFFDLRTRFPDAHRGQLATVPRISLMQGTKFGTVASPFDAVELSFSNGAVEVCGLGPHATRESSHVVEAKGATTPVRVVVRGRLLWDSLNAQSDDHVDVGYSAPDQPLRLQAPDYIEAIWPLVIAETPT